MYSATSIIRTSLIQTSGDQKIHYTTHVQKAWPMIFRGCGHRLSDELLTDSVDLPWTKLTDQLFSEHCWPWSCGIGIVYRLGIINQVRNIGTSVIRTFHLSGVAAINRWTKGSGWSSYTGNRFSKTCQLFSLSSYATLKLYTYMHNDLLLHGDNYYYTSGSILMHMRRTWLYYTILEVRHSHI